MGNGVGQMLKNLFPGIGVEGGPGTPPDHSPGGTQPGATGEPIDPTAPPTEPPPAKFNPVTGEPIKEPAENQESKDPLAHFSDLFDNSKQQANDPEPTIGSQDLFTTENMGKILESLPSFTDHITEETREALAKGEDPQAVMKAFNEVGQGAYSAALQHAVRLSETLTAKQLERMEAGFSDKINQHQVNQSITQHKAIKDSPVLQAGISIIAERLQKTNPTASPDWITQQATKYFLDSAAVLSGASGDDSTGGPGGKPSPGAGDTDWVDFATHDGSESAE